MSKEVKAYIQAEMRKAERSLRAAQKLLEDSLTEDAISRAYYAVFHSARCALKAKGIETTSHQGLISQFGLHLVKPGFLATEYGDILRQEKEDRETGDYEPDAVFGIEEATERVRDAERFIKRIKEFLREKGLL